MIATPRRTLLLVLALAGALLLGSCSDSSDDSGAVEVDSTETTINPDLEPAPDLTDAAPPGEVAEGDAVPSAGCGTSSVRSVVLEKDFLDDSDRWFLLSTPLEHDGETPLPLVLDFHGLAEGAEVHSRMSNLSPFALENGFALVLPHGTGTPVRWDADTDVEANADLQYTADLLDQLEAELCIDTSRIYATGLSNGAFMSSALACSMADRIAAVAPVAGVVRPEVCEPGRPMPVLSFHGTADPILLFNGGVGGRLSEVLEGGPPSGEELPEPDIEGEGFPAAMHEWAEANGCNMIDHAEEELITETALQITWPCNDEGAVQFIVLDKGGHSWPGSEFSLELEEVVGITDMSIDANELIWSFFQRFRLPEA